MQPPPVKVSSPRSLVVDTLENKLFRVSGNGFKFGSSDKFVFSFSGVKSPGKSPKSPGGEGYTGDDSEQEIVEDNGEHIHFSPIIPLPEEVAVVTGEEDEDVLYCHRAKLFRFVDSDWKERGVGDFKILKHKKNNKIRFLMRRDQVLKVCLNHFITGSLVLNTKDDKSFIWSAADYSEGEVEQCSFALRFKTPDIAKEFKQAVDNVLKDLNANGSVPFT
jgi:E3 SUMO-protein ligase RanBP2